MKHNSLNMTVMMFFPALFTLVSCICFRNATPLAALNSYTDMFHSDKIPFDSQWTKNINDDDFLSVFIRCLICTKLFI